MLRRNSLPKSTKSQMSSMLRSKKTNLMMLVILCLRDIYLLGVVCVLLFVDFLSFFLSFFGGVGVCRCLKVIIWSSSDTKLCSRLSTEQCSIASYAIYILSLFPRKFSGKSQHYGDLF